MNPLLTFITGSCLLATVFYCEHRYAHTSARRWAGLSFVAMFALVLLAVWMMAEMWGAKA